MKIPDYDDYYSLTEYASRFVSSPEKYISLWISQVSVISKLELWEENNGNDAFRKESVPAFLSKIYNDEVLDINDVVDTLSISSIFIEDNEVFAHLDIFYDFVGFLLQSGIVR